MEQKVSFEMLLNKHRIVVTLKKIISSEYRKDHQSKQKTNSQKSGDQKLRVLLFAIV